MRMSTEKLNRAAQVVSYAVAFVWGALMMSLLVGYVRDAWGQYPQKEARWTDLTRSPTSRKLFGWNPTTTSTDASYFEDHNDRKLLVKWGSHLKLTCSGGDAADKVLVCFTMDGSFGYNNEPSMGGGFDCDAPCGFFDDSAGPSGIADHMPCTVLLSGSTLFELVTPGSFSWGGLAPTSRDGRCVGAGVPAEQVGSPCDVDGECGSGDCLHDSLGPAGVFISGQATDATMTCQAEVKI